jgi:CBS domain-containing protein
MKHAPGRPGAPRNRAREVAVRISDLMKREPQRVLTYETCRLAARRMRDENVGFLPVCDSEGRVLGTVTDRDIAIRLVADGLAPEIPVGDVMSREVVACHLDDELTRAEQLMAASQKSRLVVVDDDGRLRGVVSLSDVAEHDMAHAAETIVRVSRREVSLTHPA